MTADIRLLAYLDGELDPEGRAAFEAEMAADPALAAQVAAHRALAARVSAAYAPVLDEPVPPQLLAMASVANDRGARPSPRLPRLPWAALAACLAVGLIAGRLALPQAGPLVSRGGVLLAQGGLARALTTQLAAQDGVVKVGLTFKAADGRYCRTFQSARDGLAGLTCRRDGRWVAETVAAFHPEASPDYRTAASQAPPAVLAAVDATIVGAPLDATAERAARDRAWVP
jgi:hypothetical protein